MMTEKKPVILTLSRRTDAAFHAGALLKALDAGYVDVPNPYSGKPYRVSLLPEDILLFTLWTKNPNALHDIVDELQARKIKTAMFVSITGYPSYIEKNVPAADELIASIEYLSSKLSADALWWRYDPIIISERLSVEWHVDNFAKLTDKIWKDKTHRVIFSLAHIDESYSRIRKRLVEAMKNNHDALMMPSIKDAAYDGLYRTAIKLFEKLSAIARQYGIQAEVCCSPKIRTEDISRISRGSCLSESYIRKIVGDMPDMKIKGTRKGSAAGIGYAACTCLESRDIGIYGSCLHGCVYCYADRTV
jgi:DNA repair photolyase